MFRADAPSFSSSSSSWAGHSSPLPPPSPASPFLSFSLISRALTRLLYCPPPQPGASLDGLEVSIGSADSVTGCSILPLAAGDGVAAPPAAPSAAPPASSQAQPGPAGAGGYAGWSLACGTTGSQVTFRLPSSVAAAVPPPRVAVKLCTVKGGSAAPGSATLWMQTGGGAM